MRTLFARLLFVSLFWLGVCATHGWAALTVGSDALPQPVGNFRPIDYIGEWSTAPPWDDTSIDPDYPEEPTHSFDLSTGEIKMGNVDRPDLVKLVWMHLTFGSQGGIAPQPHGDVVIAGEWATITDPAAGVTLTGAAWKHVAGGNTEIWQTWTIIPQPEKETINITNLNWKDKLERVEVVTNCVPEPSTLLTFTGLLGLGLIGYWKRRHMLSRR